VQRRVWFAGRWITVTWVKVHCANCGCDGPYVVKQHLRPGQVGQPTFAFYLCDDKVKGCAERYGLSANHQMIPDELFWTEAQLVMLEEYGRVLTGPEVEHLAADPSSVIAKLIKHRDQVNFGGT